MGERRWVDPRAAEAALGRRAVAAAILREAEGRTCGGCRHLVAGRCALHRSCVTGEPLLVVRASAVACGDYLARDA